ncbi:MAG TPA: hypothetical protein VEH84_14870, partial [Alphaproteobacteria bacterium]|nr:hypothetical protein [Alphaproteobacteria bacterium]
MLAQGVKPRGQLLFTDYTLDPHLDDVKAVHAWQDQTDAEPHMLTLKQYVSQLANRGFEVRVVEDLTDVHRRTILTSWQRLYESLKAKQEGGAEARNDQLTAEADRWGKCVMAIKGGLRVHRFMALRMRT